ncbi:cytochrome b/b6 domain-containing protein [Phenylobacterium sp.]|uniref:cytochrome b/b6 domain-containing protein n=1 Tax=Phenylobacterium sp. TaxID=1871053 RepID=UPI0035B0E603
MRSPGDKPLLVRLTHAVNALAILVLVMSGLQVFNAHPALYWGQKSTFDTPWLQMGMIEAADRAYGVTQIGSVRLDTTGLFGVSGAAGEPRGFPAWATLPSYRDLASGRRWHFFFAWVLVLNGAVYLTANAATGRGRRFFPARDELTPGHLAREIADHARLRFAPGLNTLQKLSYLGMVLAVLPLMVATGLTMSPGMNAAWPWLVELFGGRQSARSIHFICASLVVAFVLVHLAMVAAVAIRGRKGAQP